MTQLRVGFVGDSITNGTGDETLLGWTIRLGQTERQGGHDVTVYNLGVRADTSAMVAARWEAECAARLLPAYACATVFAVGINDSAYEESADKTGRRVPLGRSVEIISGMAQQAKRFGPVLWVGPTPVEESMLPVSPYPGLSFNFENGVIAEYGGAYAARAGEIDVPYLDLFTPLSADADWFALLTKTDGLHPPAAGYEKVAALIGAWGAWRALLD
jgi:acyl-CoA thioesterase I